MKRGFTLLEALIVVAIIAILVTIAGKGIIAAKFKSKLNEVRSSQRLENVEIINYLFHHMEVTRIKQGGAEIRSERCLAEKEAVNYLANADKLEMKQVIKISVIFFTEPEIGVVSFTEPADKKPAKLMVMHLYFDSVDNFQIIRADKNELDQLVIRQGWTESGFLLEDRPPRKCIYIGQPEFKPVKY